MILYLLKWGFCLLVALCFYKCFLENEKMHRFNRFFLLGSLGFSLLAPLLSFEVQSEVILLADVTAVQRAERGLATTLRMVAVASETDDSVAGIWRVAYWLVTGLLLARFGWNLYALFRKISGCPTVPFGSATLVLIPENGLPYTFLHYLFVDQIAYQNRSIEDELFAHEMAHIRQKHSFDILLIELLTCFFWFNPVLIGYKRAIQLNHEFLADEAVTNRCPNVVHYQHLLLSKLSSKVPILLTSTLTFQTTKQRFKMMTKETSRAKALIMAVSAVCLLIELAMAMSTQTVAQSAPGPAKSKTTNQEPETSVTEMERLYGDKLVLFPSQTPSRKAIQRRFSELSAEEKKNVVLIKPQARRTPTEAEFSAWKNSKKYGIWVDDKRIRDFANTTLEANNIASYSGSYVHKNARQPEGYLYQMDLMTRKNYAAYLKDQEKSPFLVLVRDIPKAR